MLGTLTKNLFRRPQPDNDSEAHGSLDRNAVIEIVETVEGKMLDGISTWYRASDGFFYWGGGVEIVNGVSHAAVSAPAGALVFDPKKMSWAHEFLEIPFIWNDIKTMGRDVTVGVIDTGVDDTHVDFTSNIHPLSKNLVGISSAIQDTQGHGTNMAGIIAARGSKVFGVAPESKLIIIKCTERINGVDINKVSEAVNYAASIPEVDVVSISFSFLRDDPELRQAIKNCIEQNKIVVAAIGNIRDILSPADDDTFPACYNSGVPKHEGVVAVGAFDKHGHLCSFSNWNPHLFFLGPGDLEILTTGLNNSVVKGSGTSIASAFISGCIALMISFQKKNNPQKIRECVPTLLSTCDDMGPTIGFDIQHGYGRINLRNAFVKLKTM